jgi:hypothetical protein
MSFRRLLPGLMLVLAPAVASAQTAAAPKPKPAQLPLDSMERARKLTKWFYSNQLDSILVQVDSASRGQTRTALERNLSTLAERAGEEVQVIEEKFITRGGMRQYWRTAKFSSMGEPVLLRFVMSPSGAYAGIGLSPLSSAPPIDPQ